MIALDCDAKGRLRVSFFVSLIREYIAKVGSYIPNAFKLYVEGLGVLAAADWDCESNGYAKWKHRVDRAAQKVFTGI
jgi:hypothetical protein